MTTELTPIAVGDQILSLPTSLAESINVSRQRFDAMKEEEEDPEEEADETDEEESSEDAKMSFADKMKAAKAKKAKKDSIDADDIDQAIDHIDALEAENKILAALLQGYQGEESDSESHEDADDEVYMDDEMMDSRTPQEIALELVAGYEQAKPFLPMEATIADYGDIYDIYEDAISARYPDLLMDPELDDMQNANRLDPNDADELRGAFLMMVAASRPMQQKPSAMSMDSADRSFAAALGVRKDSAAAMRPAPTPTAYY